MSYTKNETEIVRIDKFLNCMILKLGLNYSNLGTRYLQELVKLAYCNNMFETKYKDLCSTLSQNLNVNIKKIDSNIYNSINSININLAKKNFKDVFHIEFDYFYLSPKKLTLLFLNALNSSI